MSAEVVLALDVPDPALEARLREILTEAAGVRLAGPGEAADARVTPAAPSPSGAALRRDPGAVLAALTPREGEVLGLLAQGASNKLIARTLGISTHTAKFHVAQLLDKLDAVGRTDAVAHAARLGLIHL